MGFVAFVPLLTRSSATPPNWMHSTQIPVGNKSNPQTCSEPSTELFIMLKILWQDMPDVQCVLQTKQEQSTLKLGATDCLMYNQYTFIHFT